MSSSKRPVRSCRLSLFAHLTDKTFSRSDRFREPLRVVGEVADWQLHSAEQLQQMKDGLARLKAEGKDVIIT